MTRIIIDIDWKYDPDDPEPKGAMLVSDRVKGTPASSSNVKAELGAALDNL